MAGRECYHCKQWIDEGEAHDCWTTTEAALTDDLSDDLKDAWERLRATAAALGDQRIYASGSCIMFARDTCYLFVRPRRSFLEVNLFLGRALAAPQVRRIEQRSKTKVVNILQLRHRDEIEAPVTDWLREAYELPVALAAKPKAARAAIEPAGKATKPASPGKQRSPTKSARPKPTATSTAVKPASKRRSR
jgi:hypothetical protein